MSGGTDVTLKKFMKDDEAAWGDKLGDKKAGNKKDGWADFAPHRIRFDGTVLCAGGPSHWQNRGSLKVWVEKVCLPVLQAHCDRQGVAIAQCEHNAILHIDAYPVHLEAAYREWLREEHPYFHCVFVPAGCTGQIQIADKGINRPFKSYFTAEHTLHMVNQTRAELRAGVKPSDVHFDTRSGVVAPLAMKWLYVAHANIVHTNIVLNTLRSVGYLCVFDKKHSNAQHDPRARIVSQLGR